MFPEALFGISCWGYPIIKMFPTGPSKGLLLAAYGPIFSPQPMTGQVRYYATSDSSRSEAISAQHGPRRAPDGRAKVYNFQILEVSRKRLRSYTQIVLLGALSWVPFMEIFNVC